MGSIGLPGAGLGLEPAESRREEFRTAAPIFAALLIVTGRVAYQMIAAATGRTSRSSHAFGMGSFHEEEPGVGFWRAFLIRHHAAFPLLDAGFACRPGCGFELLPKSLMADSSRGSGIVAGSACPMADAAAIIAREGAVRRTPERSSGIGQGASIPRGVQRLQLWTGGSQTLGRRTVAVVPWLRTLARVMAPPVFSTAALAMARPRPEPPVARAREGSAR